MYGCDFLDISDIDLDFSSEQEEDNNQQNSVPQENNKKSDKVIQSNKQKKRTPRPSNKKNNLLNLLDFDELMDGIAEEQKEDSDKKDEIEKKEEKKEKEEEKKAEITDCILEMSNIDKQKKQVKKDIKKDNKIDLFPIDIQMNSNLTPIQLFEHNIINYLNSNIKSLIPLFLDELKYNLEESLDYDHQIHDFLSQLRYDIETVINQQSSIINAELTKARNYLNFGFYFDELTLPNHSSSQHKHNSSSSDNKYISLSTGFFNNIDKSIKELQIYKEKMIEKSSSKLKDIKSESDQLKNHLRKYNKSEENKKKLYNIQYIIEREQITLDFYDKQIQEVCNRQSRLRSHFQEIFEYQRKTFHLHNEDDDKNEDKIFVKDELNELINQIKFNQNKLTQQKSRFSKFYDDINSTAASIRSDIKELFEKSRNIEFNKSKNKTKSYQNSFQPSAMPNISTYSSDYYPTNQSYLMNNSSNISTSSNLVVCDVLKRLEKIQKISKENISLLSNI